MKLAIISDTHGLLRPEVIDILRGCDAILHAGDIDRPNIVAELEKIAPLYAVRGNADKEWAAGLPKTLTVKLGGRTFYLVHNRKDVTAEAENADYIVFGHSHRYEEKMTDGKMWLNPGSCGKRRFSQPVTMMVVEIDGEGSSRAEKSARAEGNSYAEGRAHVEENSHVGKSAHAEGNSYMEEAVHIERIDIAGETPVAVPAGQDMAAIVKKVVRDMNRGKVTREIARANGISEELAEQICRMYATHPGIDVDGILNRIMK